MSVLADTLKKTRLYNLYTNHTWIFRVEREPSKTHFPLPKSIYIQIQREGDGDVILVNLEKMSPRQIRQESKREMVGILNRSPCSKYLLVGRLCAFNNWKASTNMQILLEMEMSGVIDMSDVNAIKIRQFNSETEEEIKTQTDNELKNLLGQ